MNIEISSNPTGKRKEVNRSIHAQSDAISILQRITFEAWREKNPNFGLTNEDYWKAYHYLKDSMLKGNRIGVDLESAEWRFEALSA